ncbi:MAG: tetratricopeptide repeat protein [Pseudomonadales bacterium]
MPALLPLIFISLLLMTACATTTDVKPEPVADVKVVTEERIIPLSEEALLDLLVAEIAGQRGNFEEALPRYQRQAVATRDTEIVARAAQMASYIGTNKEALESSSLWLEIEPESTEAAALYTSALIREGRILEAIDSIESKLDEGEEVNFTALAANSLELSDKEIKAVLERFTELMTRYPHNTSLQLGRAILVSRFDPEEALQTARQVRADDPDSEHAIGLEANFLIQLGRKDEALQVLQLAIDDGAGSGLQLQYARLVSQKDMIKARSLLMDLLEQQPGNGEVIYSLAVLNRELGLYGDADNFYHQLIHYARYESEGHYYLGLLAQRKGLLDLAAGHYEMVQADSHFLPAMQKLAAIRVNDNQVSEFSEFLQRQRLRYPDFSIELYLLESSVLMSTENYPKTHQILSSALQQYPDDTELLYARSLVSDKRGDFPLLESDLNVILSSDPDNAMVLNALGYSLSNHTQRYDEALAMIQRSLKLEPGEPAALDSLGWVYFKMGKLPSAILYLTEAYKRSPDPEIAAHLGEALWASGHPEQAKKLWQDALTEAPEHPVLRDTIRRLAPQESL